MNESQHARMPRYLDLPARVMLWTMDEVIAFLVPFTLLVLVWHRELLGLLVSPLALMAVKRLKGEEGPGYLWQLAYWHLPSLGQFQCLPPSHCRRYRG